MWKHCSTCYIIKNTASSISPVLGRICTNCYLYSQNLSQLWFSLSSWIFYFSGVMWGKPKTVSVITHIICFSKSYSNAAYGCNCASLYHFQDIIFRNSCHPTFFFSPRQDRFACKFRVPSKIHVGEQASGPDIASYISLQQPNHFTEKKTRKKIVLIYSYVNFEDI